jgi:hypothetical protein
MADAPGERGHYSGVFDGSSGAFLVYGGFVSKPTFHRLSDIWAFDGKGWMQTTADSGLKRMVPGLAYDSKRKRVLMLGGSGDDGVDSGMLSVLQNGKWQDVITDPRVARGDFGMVYDSARDRVVIFGGINKGQVLGDTWEFDGVAWKQVATNGPQGVVGPAMVYDSARRKTVLFGGLAKFGDYSSLGGTTWEWDGQSWNAMSSPTPPKRLWAASTYDSKLNRVLMHGGAAANATLTDTWAHDKTGWKKIADDGPAFAGAVMWCDPKTGRPTLFGCREANEAQSGQTWVLKADKWSRLP